jgi:MarR family transcriptional regulator, lower aerobic nicotinate degradation pathway regulator
MKKPMKKPAAASPLEAHLGYWLRLVSNHVSHEFKGRVEAHGATVAEWVVLRKLLDLGPSAPSQIAEALGMTRGAISKLDDRLAAKGLIEIGASDTDGRQQVVRLSRRGRELVPRLAALADENDAAFFGVLDSHEQATLRRLLARLIGAHQLAGTPID